MWRESLPILYRLLLFIQRYLPLIYPVGALSQLYAALDITVPTRSIPTAPSAPQRRKLRDHPHPGHQPFSLLPGRRETVNSTVRGRCWPTQQPGSAKSRLVRAVQDKRDQSHLHRRSNYL